MNNRWTQKLLYRAVALLCLAVTATFAEGNGPPASRPDDTAAVRDWHLYAGPRPSRAALERLRERVRSNPKDADALLALARIYSDRELGEYSPAQARAAITDAALFGSAEAKVVQDCLAIQGANSSKEVQAPINELQTAAPRDALASVMLGKLLADGVPALPRDVPRAIDLLKFAADHQIVEAWVCLGNIYESQQHDTARALDCYSKAAARGYPEACLLLSQRYFAGDGVKADPQMAFQLMRKAGEISPDAVAYLSQYYFDGIGVPADPVKARDLVRQSADQGSAAGAKLLSEVYLDGKFGGDYDRELGFHWLTISAERGNASGLAVAGLLKLTGLGTPRDLEQSRVLFGAAKEAGVDGTAANLVDLMLAAAYDPAKTQSAYDEISAGRAENRNAAVMAAILQLTGNVANAHGLSAEDLLKAPKDHGDPVATLLYRLLRDRDSKY